MARGKGEGRGARYVYTTEQAELFFEILQERPEARSIAHLCNVPVFLWLYYGEEYVPVRQVRRALATSVRTDRGGAQRSYERSRRDAREIVLSLVDAGASRDAKSRVTDVLTDVIYRGDFSGPKMAELRDLLSSVAAPVSGGGSENWRARAADGVVTNAIARALAMEQLPMIPDELFERARLTQLCTMISYARDWRRMAAIPGISRFVVEPTVDKFANEACGDVLSTLGLTLLGHAPPLLPPGKHVATFRTADADKEVELVVVIEKSYGSA